MPCVTGCRFLQQSKMCGENWHKTVLRSSLLTTGADRVASLDTSSSSFTPELLRAFGDEASQKATKEEM